MDSRAIGHAICEQKQGTVNVRYTLEQDVGQAPSQTAVIFDADEGDRAARLEVDTELKMRFVHRAPATGERTAAVDLRALDGARALEIFVVWSPAEVRIHVGDGERQGELLTGRG